MGPWSSTFVGISPSRLRPFPTLGSVVNAGDLCILFCRIVVERSEKSLRVGGNPPHPPFFFFFFFLFLSCRARVRRTWTWTARSESKREKDRAQGCNLNVRLYPTLSLGE